MGLVEAAAVCGVGASFILGFIIGRLFQLKECEMGSGCRFSQNAES